ncbi:MAG: XdhC family protein [Candidatus Heimdallarchaeaceae archaeon]
MNEEQYWKSVLAKLKQGQSVILVVIIERTGSAPNIPGAKMFITLEDSLGTVGGGNSEHRLFDRARDILKKGDFIVEKVFMEHTDSEHEDSSGMICSGTQTFALISLEKKSIPTIKEIINSLEKAEPGILTINTEGISFDAGIQLADDNIFSEDDQFWTYQENTGIKDKLFIVGGGHVSLALSRIMETLDFHITVFDDREELPTMVSNTYAHEKRKISYDDVASYIPEGENIYVAIMTFGHKSDEKVLERIINKKCKYIGMMASPAKKLQVFDNLEMKGISKELLDSIYSPIGIKIKSNTPEEIAISIAAEIIKIKNAK